MSYTFVVLSIQLCSVSFESLKMRLYYSDRDIGRVEFLEVFVRASYSAVEHNLRLHLVFQFNRHVVLNGFSKESN